VQGTSSGQVTHSRHLSQVGPVYADVPDDLDLSSILAAARDSFPFFGQGMRTMSDRQPYMPQPYTPRSRALGGVSSRSPGSIVFTVTFASSHADVPVRLPSGQRSFNMTVRSLDAGSQQACSFQKLPYVSQNVGQCQNMAPGTKWLAELVDAGALVHPAHWNRHRHRDRQAAMLMSTSAYSSGPCQGACTTVATAAKRVRLSTIVKRLQQAPADRLVCCCVRSAA
jgi:hypothetical protein